VTDTGWRIAVDRGGTFTDAVGFCGGAARHAKVLNSAAAGDPALRAIRAILHLSPDAPITAGDVDQVRLGTTVATNALLTRTGDRTVLVVTAGLADLPVIGNQTRPDLFALEIDRTPPIAHRIVEAHERTAVDGEIVRPLDEDRLRRDLREARSAGCVCVAIALMHGWLHTAHERRIATIAREIGFEEVVTSDVSPIRGIVPRMDTVSLDASLSPVLQSGIASTADGLDGIQVLCMQSSGHLVDVADFRGCRAVLSGPAGGLVGAAAEARRHGLDHIVAFDMGGTSTDVSWFGGAFDRGAEAVIAGARVRTPMLRIHTVAAGGGSICTAGGGRLRVGPESAGSDPGPACYRAGGPATITDCHVALGRLPVEAMPTTFGPSGTLPIDPAASTSVLEGVAAASGAATAMDTAEGLLDIAVESMAGAIREVSVQRGHDLRGATLCAFGGAGGQCACRIADRLGMHSVLIPARAGVLSAQGIATAEVGAVRRRSVECPLTARVGIEAAIQTAASEAVAELEASGLEAASQHVTVAIRAEGWDRSIGVPFGDAEGMAADFRDASRRRFGFEPRGPLHVEAVEVDVQASPAAALRIAAEPATPGPTRTTRMWCRGRWQDVPVVRDTNLDTVDGPAIVLHSGSTTVIEPGWSATRHLDTGGIVLRRTAALPARTFEASSPADIEIANRRLLSICREMGMVLQNTAASVNVKERRDYSCAVFDPAGHLVANGPHMPVHLGSMGASVQRVLERVREQGGPELSTGDAFLDNDPAHGGTHLPDLTVITPVFDRGELIFFVASRAHHADVGGVTPGSMPPHSTTIAEEGVVFDAAPLVRDGVFLEEDTRRRLASGRWPARSPDINIEDLRAQLGANARGIDLLTAMRAEWTPAGFAACMQSVRLNAAACVREMLRTREGGSFCCPTEDGGRVQVRIDIADGKAVIDFTGTSPQQPGNANAPRAVVRAAVLYVLRCLVAEDIPLNDGCFDPITLRIPEGCMLSPRPGAAVVAGNVETSQIVVDAMLAAFGAQAACQGTMNNLTFGDDDRQYYETLCGGSGGGPTFSGQPAVHTHMTNSLLTDPEVLESRFPVRLEQFEIRKSSGGGGAHPGGDGVVRSLRFLEPLQVSLLSGRRASPPHGLQGGDPGAAGEQFLQARGGSPAAMPSRFCAEARAGDLLIIRTPGGGGWGPAPDAEAAE
jgi:5-oxoprolinase (ATP-hydrolysing)